MKITINVPEEMQQYLMAYEPATEFERNAKIMYPYLLTGEASLRLTADFLGVRMETLLEYYKDEGLPFDDGKVMENL